MSSNPFEPKPMTDADIFGKTDTSWDSSFHTLGSGSTQAAPGNHKHTYDEIEGIPDPPTIVTDHGALNGLGDDDHSQYFNQARGDARYPRTDGTGATGNWGINITGNANSVDNQHFNWDDRGAVTTYFWGVSNYGDSSLVWTELISKLGHGHHPSESGIRGFRHGPYSVNGNTEITVGPFSKNADELVVHSLQHSSAYLFATMDNYQTYSYHIKIRNSTTATNHTGIYIHAIHMRLS